MLKSRFSYYTTQESRRDETRRLVVCVEEGATAESVLSEAKHTL